MSGGVDSSVTAALLVEQGYDVTGVYMKNWSKDLPGFQCPWKEDYQDAKRVAVRLGIPFEVFDFEDEYFDKVVEYMLDGFKAGITPNPDIMCNQEIKFKLFYETAREKGADYIATGHYACVANHESEFRINSELNMNSHINGRLLMAKDDNKDQTYFLYRVSHEALARTLFPLGGFTKPEVRQMAKARGLITANKKESMGICFVGKVGIREFLTQFVDKKYMQTGKIIDQNGAVIGEHDGAIFYTIGQRHGLDVGGGLPFYVSGKDMKKNEVYVTSNLQDDSLWASEIRLTSLHWINEAPTQNKSYRVRTRHRAPLISCGFKDIAESTATLLLEEKIRALTPGQSAVIYDGDECIGGGIIA